MWPHSSHNGRFASVKESTKTTTGKCGVNSGTLDVDDLCPPVVGGRDW